MRIASLLPHLLAAKNCSWFQHGMLFSCQNTHPLINSNNRYFNPSQNISSFENVTFVRSSAKCFTYIWQILDDLSSPILRSALRRLLFPQLPDSRATCPFLSTPRAPSENSVYCIVICCLWSIYPAKGECCICLCHPLSRIGHQLFWANREEVGEQVRGQSIFILNKHQNADGSFDSGSAALK